LSALVAIAPGPCVSLQDFGRRGHLAEGVPESGAMDPDSLRLANGLVGNPPDEAALEFAFSGGRFRADSVCRIAVAGGDFAIKVDGKRRRTWQTIDLAPGAVVEIGAAPDAVYGYLAVAGGFNIPPVMGSRSTHVRFGVGPIPGALTAETTLPLRTPGPSMLPAVALPEGFGLHGAGPVRVMLGPQDDYFEADVIAEFLHSTFTISTKADRMGCRLEGPKLKHAQGFDVVSDGIAMGSIQVPGSGELLVLLADRQTTGGYPKIATIIGADLGRFAQLRPGTSVRFEAVSVTAAHAALRAHRASIEAAIEAIAPIGDANDSSFLLSVNLISGAVSSLDETWEYKSVARDF